MFGRGKSLQVLVEPDVVVESFELTQGHLQCSAIGHGEFFEQGLERAKQRLDHAVLPRGVFLVVGDAGCESTIGAWLM